MKGRALVFAPHPDDEVIGCGGLLKRLVAAGVVIRVVVVSDGAAGLPPNEAPALRRQESLTGLGMVGVETCEFWDFPDGALPFGGKIEPRYQQVVDAFKPDLIFLPHPAEQHVDHRSLTRGLLAALEGRWRGMLWFYETTSPSHPVNRYEDITDSLEDKLAAVGAHESQMASFDYVRYCRHLAAMRGVSLDRPAAEAFLVYEWDGSAQQFFPAEPIVSIVVRASNADLVVLALQSLEIQAYPWLEVILVWFGDASPPDISRWSFRICVVPGCANRGANLNLGVAAARGELVGFLDEDDVFYVEHLTNLVEELTATPALDIVFSGCRVVKCFQDGLRVVTDGEVEIIDKRYEPGLLLFGNYITLHSLLIRRHVFRALDFDEALEAYEDWDFLARAEQAGYLFSRVSGIGCEYRLFGPKDEVVSIKSVHARKGHTAWRDAVRDRICARIKPADITHLEQYVNDHKKKFLDRTTQWADAQAELRLLRAETAEYREAASALRDAIEQDSSLPSAVDEAMRHLIASKSDGPLISVILPAFNTDPRLLAATLQSIVDQSYPRWQLCLVDDASTRMDTLDVLENFRERYSGDRRVIIVRRPSNGGIVRASNDALNLATGTHVAFVDHDDLLPKDALWEVASAINREPGLKLLYSNNRTVDHVGRLLNVFEKPGWSPYTLLSYNYVNHLTVVLRSLVADLGGLREDYNGCQDWDLLLRVAAVVAEDDVCHLPLSLYDWRATDTSVSYTLKAKPWMAETAKRMLANWVAQRVNKPIQVQENHNGAGFIVNWSCEERPVTVVIPMHGNVEDIQRCVDGLLNRTAHRAMSLLLVADTGGSPRAQELMDALGARPQIRIIEQTRSSGWSAMANRAIGDVDTEAVLFLDGNIDIHDPDWLGHMLRYLDFEDVGAISAVLTSPQGNILHAGIAMDPQRIAVEIGDRMASQEAAAVRDVSAVTGACMLTRRSAFLRVGCCDESLSSRFGDVDYCLALRLVGYRVIVAADARLVQHEAATPDMPEDGHLASVFRGSTLHMQRKWGRKLREGFRARYHVEATTRILNALG
ncbi:MAG: glycosyltransferase [Sulfurisoma sp.]|nr:glycosyltransferase [Sulfurisoma sp.]